MGERFVEYRVPQPNGDIISRDKDGAWFIRHQVRNGLSPMQLIDEGMVDDETKEMFHVKQSKE